jgi:molybdate transport system permease protein
LPFLFYKGSLFSEILFSERTLFSVRLSLTTATAATIISVLIALPSAYALSRFNFFGRQIIDTILELPMIVSPVSLGAMILISFNTPAGQFVQERGMQFVFTVYGIVLAQLVTTAGIAIRLIKAAMDEIPQDYENAARTLGATPTDVFFSVILPLSKRVLSRPLFSRGQKQWGNSGATITIAGSMAMKTETLPVAIFMRLAGADIEGTAVLVLILITIGLGVLYGVRLFAGKKSYA